MKPGLVWRLRGAAFAVVMALSLVIYIPFLLLLYPLPLSYRFRFSNVWTRFFVATVGLFVGIRHRFHGLENLPDGPCVYYSKHQSTWETLAYQTVFPHYVWVLKREALWIPFFGWGLATLKPIAIDRGAGGAAVDQIVEQGRQRLQQGLGVMIFPEGTRTQPGVDRRYGLGGAILACATGTPLVPIAHNAGCFWPPKKIHGYKPGVIDVVIGEPLDPNSLSEEEVTARLKAWMDATADELARNAEVHPNFRDPVPNVDQMSESQPQMNANERESS